MVAEAIELDVQREQLRDAQCDLGQGYLFARPMSAGEAEDLLAASRDWAGATAGS